MAKRYHATQKFLKLAALNADIDAGGFVGAGARREKAKLADSWRNRKSNNVAGFFDRKKARDIKRGAV